MPNSPGVKHLPYSALVIQTEINFTISEKKKISVQESVEAEYNDDISVSLESGLNSSTISLLQIS